VESSVFMRLSAMFRPGYAGNFLFFQHHVLIKATVKMPTWPNRPEVGRAQPQGMPEGKWIFN
jgi:hypothetical protein